MVNGLLDSKETAEFLGITMNHLRQIQHRKSLVWVKKVGRNVYYEMADIHDYTLRKKTSPKE